MSWARSMRTGFAAVYPVRGAPGISPAQLAMVTVLQFCENLTDRQPADEAPGRVDWKYCLGLELADEGFEFTALKHLDHLFAAGARRAQVTAVLRACSCPVTGPCHHQRPRSGNARKA
jgi:Transposase domain (DUF772)